MEGKYVAYVVKSLENRGLIVKQVVCEGKGNLG